MAADPKYTVLESDLIGFLSDLVSGAYGDLDEVSDAADKLLEAKGIDLGPRESAS